jgi:hypothetical protein
VTSKAYVPAFGNVTVPGLSENSFSEIRIVFRALPLVPPLALPLLLPPP